MDCSEGRWSFLHYLNNVNRKRPYAFPSTLQPICDFDTWQDRFLLLMLNSDAGSHVLSPGDSLFSRPILVLFLMDPLDHLPLHRTRKSCSRNAPRCSTGLLLHFYSCIYQSRCIISVLTFEQHSFLLLYIDFWEYFTVVVLWTPKRVNKSLHFMHLSAEIFCLFL